MNKLDNVERAKHYYCTKKKKQVLMVKIILSDNYDIATKGIKHN